MKKILIAVLFVCVSAICSALPFNLGAKIGGNFSTFTVNKSESKYTFQPGIDVGFFARANFQKLYLQPEVFYSYQSFKMKDKNVAKDQPKFNSHSLNVPILLGYKLFDVKLTNMRVFLGPEFSYVLFESSEKDCRNPANIAGVIGAGLDIAMLTIDLRYGYTFTKAMKEEVKFNPHTNVISFSFGWKFL